MFLRFQVNMVRFLLSRTVEKNSFCPPQKQLVGDWPNFKKIMVILAVSVEVIAVRPVKSVIIIIIMAN